MEAGIVTQFGFDDDATVRFILDLRRRGIGCPLLIGIAGPASATRLMQFAMRCGVRTAGRFLVRDGRRIPGVLSGDATGRLLHRLSGVADDGRGGDIRAHFFAFGGGVPTAEWIDALQDRHLRSA
jgi:methylenetetrahydrofolate reductase (NADPH)